MREIKGFEGLYSVTEDGRVYSHPRFNSRTPKYLKGGFDKDGYRQVTLRKDNKNHTCRVHRLVVDAFLPADNKRTQINHIDGDKQNNCVDNLEWCTASENQLHSVKVLKNRQKPTHRKISIDDASEICEAYATGLFRQWELAEHFDVCRQAISNIVTGKYGAIYCDAQLAKGR